MRLIDGDNLEGFAYEPTFGTRDMIENWIEETDLPFEIKAGYDKELKKLCWNVLEGCMNVIKTEETAYDLGKVIDRLKDVAIERRGNNGGMGGEKVVNLDDAIEIVKQVGAGTDDVCEWKYPKEIMDNTEFEVSCNSRPLKRGIVPNNFSFYDFKYCPYCGKKIKVVE